METGWRGEVDDVFDFAKLEVQVHPNYNGGEVILEVIYDGELIDLEQEEKGLYQPSSGFDF